MLTFCGDITCHIKDNLYKEIICNISTLWQCTGLKDKNGNLYKAFWQDNYYQFLWICIKSDKICL